jgi:hypothetical protein
MKTTKKLARALEEAKAPAWMVKGALEGRYDDFKSESATPIMDLVRDCRRFGLDEISMRARNGDFDATREESDEWMKSNGWRL